VPFFAAFFQFASAKDAGLTMGLATYFLQFVAESLVVFLQARTAPLLTSVVIFQLLNVLLEKFDVLIA
jgi:hypothetical protein